MKCQCRPRPRFFRPGSATTGDQDSSSSSEVQGLRESAPYIFFDSRSHSRPGGQSSCQYSFGNADSTSMPERNSSSMKKMFRKWVTTTQYGKNSGTHPAPLRRGRRLRAARRCRAPSDRAYLALLLA